ncbi:hypothetical protein ACI8AV_22625, partial [Geodermatophilus sp. SYSU D00804]
MRGRALPTTVAVAAVLLCAAAGALAAWVAPRLPEPEPTAIGALYAVASAATGALLVRLRPRNVIGWLLVLCGLLQAVSVGTGAYGGYGVDVADPPWPGARWVAQAGSMTWLPSLVLPATVLVAFYPSGRLPARWWGGAGGGPPPPGVGGTRGGGLYPQYKKKKTNRPAPP